MIKSSLILFLLVLFNFSPAQNLIDNPSFELSFNESKKNSIKENNFPCLNWTSGTSDGSPDYFNSKRVGANGVPDNSVGTRSAYSGRAYVGIVVYVEPKRKENISEDIQTKLKQRLVKDAYYCLSLYISPADLRKFTTNEVDYFFSSEKYDYTTEDIIKRDSYEKFVAKKGIFEPRAWNKISSCYKARGNEEYLTIGMFNTKCKVVCYNPPPTGDGYRMYFYIDEVSLTPVKDTSECNCNELVVIRDKPNNYASALNKPLVLKNINFASNKAQFLPGSDKELNQLAAYLKTNPAYKIEIKGYTDNVGKENDNVALSKLRAKAVGDFLIQAGIAKERISFDGLGSKLPIKPNDTEENRQLNRRVEVKIVK